MFFILLQSYMRPFIKERDNSLEMTSSLTLVVLYSTSWLLFFNTDYFSGLEFFQNMGAVLFFSVMVVMFIMIFSPLIYKLLTKLFPQLATQTETDQPADQPTDTLFD